MNIGIPELLFVLVFIVLPLWAVRRFPVSKGVFKVALVAFGVIVALLAYNWMTTFRTVE
jgi:hypothetical protein